MTTKYYQKQHLLNSIPTTEDIPIYFTSFFLAFAIVIATYLGGLASHLRARLDDLNTEMD